MPGSGIFQTLQQLYSQYNHPSGVAAADQSQKSVKGALDQTDPQRMSQILPQFATQIQQILNILGVMSMGGGGGGGGGGGQQQQQPNNTSNGTSANTANAISSNLFSSNTSANDYPTPPANTQNASNWLGMKISNRVGDILIEGIANGLAIESQLNGQQRTMLVLGSVINNAAYFNQLPTDFQLLLRLAFAQFEQNLVTYGLDNYPILIPPHVVVGNVTPANLVGFVPDFCSQTHYHPNVDPYPGYVEYVSITDSSNVFYTVRTANNPAFSDAVNTFAYVAQETFVADINPYILASNLSVSALNDILTDVTNQTLNVWLNITSGTGSQNLVPMANTSTTTNTSLTSTANTTVNTANNTGNMSSPSYQSGQSGQSLVGQMLPWLQQMIQQAQSTHLPKSVLDQGAIQKLLNQHGQQCAKGKQCQQLAQQALQPNPQSGSNSQSPAQNLGG
jgi:hypothetical protein